MPDGTLDDALAAGFERAWTALGAVGGRARATALAGRLLAAYAEPQRHYHAVQHLRECIGLLDTVRELAEQPAEVELALWFHDAIYSVTQGGNEAASAQWARDELAAAGVAAARIARIEALILATRHDAAPQDADQRLLVDIDLAILGAPRARFDEYERQIRAEYAHVPEALFTARRREILQGFVARPAIYATERFRASHERAARENLARAIDPGRG